MAAGCEVEFQAGKKVSVEKIAHKLKMDRVEIRNLFRYMTDLKFIEIVSIGGPVLYGHICLTEKGVMKIDSLRKKPNA